MNYIAKPIYAAFVLAAKLGEMQLLAECDNPNIHTIATKTSAGYAVMMSYSNDCLTEDLPEIIEKVKFAEDLTGKMLQVYCIDRSTTNSYRLFERNGVEVPSEEEVKELRKEGKVKPILEQRITDREPLSFKFTANATYLITVS